jgi:peptidoglycan-N-acetylglucosamine deacetylase
MSSKFTINRPLICVRIGLGSNVHSQNPGRIVRASSDNRVTSSMRSTVAASCLLASLIASGSLEAAECPGHPGALGISRTIVVDPAEHPLLGGLQYRESLPLNDHEVVLTFDDGPLQPYTTRVLETLAAECVKATFFIVGRMARGYPHLVRRIHAEGHTIANHSQNHPFTFHKMTIDQAAHEIEDGFASTRTILGDPAAVADFFRVPGLLRQDSVEQYLRDRKVMTWSLDFVADDWTHISDQEIVRRTISRIEAKGKGILLLHDIQPATAAALPVLLHELKVRGFKIVHVVQARPGLPKTETTPEQWILHRAEAHSIWPRVVITTANLPEPVLVAPNPKNFGIVDAVDTGTPTSFVPGPGKPRTADAGMPLPQMALWPHSLRLVARSPAELMPAPAAENFRYTRVWRAPVHIAQKPGPKKTVASTGSTPRAPKILPATAARASAAREANPVPPRSLPRQSGHQI